MQRSSLCRIRRQLSKIEELAYSPHDHGHSKTHPSRIRGCRVPRDIARGRASRPGALLRTGNVRSIFLETLEKCVDRFMSVVHVRWIMSPIRRWRDEPLLLRRRVTPCQSQQVHRLEGAVYLPVLVVVFVDE